MTSDLHQKALEEEKNPRTAMSFDDSNKCFVVGITGPSGCGKSTLAQNLVHKLNDVHSSGRSSSIIREARLFPEDPQYFLAPKAASYRDQNPDSETPEFVHWDAYVADLQKCIASTTAGDDDGSTHFVWIVDHFLLLHDPRVVQCLDAIIFLDPVFDDHTENTQVGHPNVLKTGVTIDNVVSTTNAASITTEEETESLISARDICRERRVQRDATRCPSEQGFLRQYYNSAVWPAYLRYTHGSTQRYIVDGHPDRSVLLQVDCLGSSKEQILSLAFSFVVQRCTNPES